jgi:hypothetical protein
MAKNRREPAREAETLQKKPLRAVSLPDAQPVFRANLVLHAIEVVLDGSLGKTEVVGNFLVREAFRDRRNQLLFPPRQSQSLPHAGAW